MGFFLEGGGFGPGEDIICLALKSLSDSERHWQRLLHIQSHLFVVQ